MNRSRNTVVVRKSTLLVLLSLIVLIPLFFGLSLSSNVSAKTISQQEATPTMVATSMPPDECVNDPTSSACLALCAENPLQNFCLSATKACADDSSQIFCSDLCSMNPNREFCFTSCANDINQPYCQDLCQANPAQQFCEKICSNLSADAEKPEYCAKLECTEKPYLEQCTDLCNADSNLDFCANICATADHPGDRFSPFCKDLCRANPDLGFCDSMCNVANAVDIDYCVDACKLDPTRDYCNSICKDTDAQIQGLSFCLDTCTRIGSANDFSTNVQNKVKTADLYNDNKYCQSICYFDPSQPFCTDMCDVLDNAPAFCSNIPCTAENVDKLPHCENLCMTDPTSTLCQEACAVNGNSVHCHFACHIDPTLAMCQDKCNQTTNNYQLLSSGTCNELCWLNPGLDYCQNYCETNPSAPFCENTCKIDSSNPYCMQLCVSHPEMEYCADLCKNNDSETCRKVSCFEGVTAENASVCSDICELKRGNYSFCSGLCESDISSGEYFCSALCMKDPTQPFCAKTCEDGSNSFRYCSDICETADDVNQYPHCKTLCEQSSNRLFCADYCLAGTLKANPANPDAPDPCMSACAANPGHPYCENTCSINPELPYCEETCLRNPNLDYCKTQCKNAEEEEKIYAHCYLMCESVSGEYNYKGTEVDEEGTDACNFLCDQAIIKATNEINENPPAQAGYRNVPVSPIPAFCKNQCDDLYSPAHDDLGMYRETLAPWCNDLCALRNDGDSPDYCYTRCDEENSALAFCDDVCFDIEAPGSASFCTDVCIYKAAIEGAISLAKEIPLVGSFVGYFVSGSGYESYTELPYCTLLKNLPPGMLLFPPEYKNDHAGWEPYIENGDSCAFHKSESPYCAALCRTVDDAAPGCKSCEFNPGMPVCSTKCSQSADPGKINYCKAICANDSGESFCDDICRSSDDPGSIPFCSSLCLQNADQDFCPDLCEKSTNPGVIPFCKSQCTGAADAPGFCKLLNCIADETSADCNADLCSDVVDPEKIPYCLHFCQTEGNDAPFCTSICGSTDTHYKFCADRIDCDTDPFQDKCSEICAESEDPGQYRWCNSLCKINYVNHDSGVTPEPIDYCEKICESSQNTELSFCPVICEDHPEYAYCTNLCEINSNLDFCPELCDKNSNQSFCTRLCDSNTPYDFCKDVCLSRPGLNACFAICEEDNTNSFCPASCGIDNNFEACAELCKSNPQLSFCTTYCEQYQDTSEVKRVNPYAYYTRSINILNSCDSVCSTEPLNTSVDFLSDVCVEINHCDEINWSTKYGYYGHSQNCVNLCNINPNMEHCDDFCSFDPTLAWCADSCENNPRKTYCNDVCESADEPGKLSFCVNKCNANPNLAYCPDVCDTSADPWKVSACINMCRVEPAKYDFCSQMCSVLKNPLGTEFCWGTLESINNQQKSYGIKMCQDWPYSPPKPICKDICLSNQAALSTLCESDDDPASDFCCTDLCSLPEYQSMDYCGDICAQNNNLAFCANRCEEGLDLDQPYCSNICKADDTNDYCAEFCDASVFLSDAEKQNYCLAHPDAPCCDRQCKSNKENLPAFCDAVCEITNNLDYCQSYCELNPDRPYCANLCTDNPHLSWCPIICESGVEASYCETLCLEDHEKYKSFCDRQYVSYDHACWPGTYAPGSVAGCADQERALCDENGVWGCVSPANTICGSGSCCQDTPGQVPTPMY